MHVGMETHDSLMDLSDHASRAELHRVGDRCRDADTLEGGKGVFEVDLDWQPDTRPDPAVTRPS